MGFLGEGACGHPLVVYLLPQLPDAAWCPLGVIRDITLDLGADPGPLGEAAVSERPEGGEGVPVGSSSLPGATLDSVLRACFCMSGL